MGIIVTEKAIQRRKIQRIKSSQRQKRAAICINCNYNNEGYCNKHLAWCGRVNYICLGIKDPYEYKMPSTKKGKNNSKNYSSDKKFSKKNNKEFTKLKEKFESNPDKVKKDLKKKYKIK